MASWRLATLRPDIRLRALDQVSDPALLEQIVKRAKNRDKRVLRLARERVKALHAEQQTQRQLGELCDAFEQLVWDGETGPAAARFVRLEAEWSALADQADADLSARVEQARERFRQQQQQHAQIRRQREAICQRLEQRLAALDQVGANTDGNSDGDQIIQQTLAEAERDWLQTGDTPEPRLQRRYQDLYAALGARRAALAAGDRQLQKSRTVLRAAERLLERAGLLQESDVNELHQRWQRQMQNLAVPLRAAAQTQFDALFSKLEQRLTRQREQKGQELADLRQLLDDLRQALDDGELQRAIEFDQQARAKLANNISLSRQQMDTLREQLGDCTVALNQLRGWRRWGTDQAREQLCEQAEALAIEAQTESDADPNPNRLADQVRALRSAWKQLDKTGGASRALWQRFDRACERAYAPAKVHFDHQAEQRRQNLEQRQALCAELEALLTDTDWDNQLDWPMLSRYEQTVQRRWRQLGPVNRGDRKAIDRRYRDALNRLQTRLRPRLEQDLARRQALIARVQALAEQDDLQAAIEATKQAQSEWQPQALASRSREQALWRQFRTACDAVFARRQAERDAQQAERRQLLEHKTALCEELETLANLDGEQLLAAAPQVQALQQTWDALGRLPKADQRLTQRLQRARQRFEQRYQAQQQAAELAGLATIAERGRLCQHLEMLLAGIPGSDADANVDVDAELSRAQTEWDRLAAADAALETPVRQRFSDVCQALAGSPDRGSPDRGSPDRGPPDERQTLRDRLGANLAAKQQLALRLEIATGSETPAEHADERMSYQVARLSTSMAERSPLPADQRTRQEIADIVRDWYGLGLLPADLAAQLEQRFDKALANVNEGTP